MIPLSTEKESTGNPLIFHALTLTGSPSVEFKENVSEQGISLSTHSFCHSSVAFCSNHKRQSLKFTFFINILDWNTKEIKLVGVYLLAIYFNHASPSTTVLIHFSPNCFD